MFTTGDYIVKTAEQSRVSRSTFWWMMPQVCCRVSRAGWWKRDAARFTSIGGTQSLSFRFVVHWVEFLYMVIFFFLLFLFFLVCFLEVFCHTSISILAHFLTETVLRNLGFAIASLVCRVPHTHTNAVCARNTTCLCCHSLSVGPHCAVPQRRHYPRGRCRVKTPSPSLLTSRATFGSRDYTPPLPLHVFAHWILNTCYFLLHLLFDLCIWVQTLYKS